jgi:subfamily B ATP-binding cassette protein MsbA
VRLYLRLLTFLRPYRARVAVAVLATLVLAGATSLYAFLIGPLLKVLLTGGKPSLPIEALQDLSREQMLTLLPLALVGAAVLRAGSQSLQSFLMQSTGQRIVADIRRALYARFLRLPQAWFARRHSGDLVSRFGVDVQTVEYSLTFAFSSYVRDTLEVLALLAVCLWLDWRLFLAAMCVVPLAALPLARFSKGLKRVSDRAQRSLGALASQVGESVANVRVVQAFCRERDELDRFDGVQGDYLKVMHTSLLLRAAFSPVVELTGVAGLAAAIYFAGSAIASGALAGETLLSFLAAMMLMYRPLKELSQTGQHVIQGIAGGQRIFDVLDAPEGPPEPADPVPARFEQAIRFHRVGFSYGDEPVLKEVDLTVPRGRTLALVGESGAGKSTLAALLLRFYDPTEGAVELDGQDTRRMRVAELRGLIAFVPQEPVLFAGTVRDNVACGNEAASEPELVAALKAAHAWEFVSQMPGGLDAPVGERGAGLSGGQRQRLALARAFLADAPIIVLDEATSALDSASEIAVQRGLEALLRDRTAIVIAHRLSTVERADEIAVLAAGRVVERGTHAELLARGGAYAALHAAQAGRRPDAPASVGAGG